MWSVGNEIPESVKNGEIETVKILRDLCHQIEIIRPVTVGCTLIKSANESRFSKHFDIVGYNEGVESVELRIIRPSGGTVKTALTKYRL